MASLTPPVCTAGCYCWSWPRPINNELQKSKYQVLLLFFLMSNFHLGFFSETWQYQIWSMWLFIFKAKDCKICGKYFKNKWESQNTCRRVPTVFGTQSTILPPGGQLPALPKNIQAAPQQAQQPCPSSCLPPGSQQLAAPGHLQAAPKTVQYLVRHPDRSSLRMSPWQRQSNTRPQLLPPYWQPAFFFYTGLRNPYISTKKIKLKKCVKHLIFEGWLIQQPTQIKKLK